MVLDPKNTSDNSEALPDVFKNVTYYVVGDVSEEVRKLLDSHGAKRDLYLSEMVSHVIADSTEPDEYSEAKELFERPVVSSEWVILSVKCGKQLPKELFALEGRLFSGIRVCPHQLDPEDARAIWGMVTYHGGRCQLKLDHSVSHLVTTETTGEKYYATTQHSDSIKVVTPDWITDSIKNGKLMEENIYHPQLLIPPKPDTPPQLEPQLVTDLPVSSTVMTASDIKTVSEPMDTSPIPGALPYHAGHSPGASRRKSSSSDEAYKTNGSRPGTPSAKEALARMVSNRLYASGKSDVPDIPVPRGAGLSPIMHQGRRPVSPGIQAGPMPLMSASGHAGLPPGFGIPSSTGLPGMGAGQPGPGLTSMPPMGMGQPDMDMPGMGHHGMPHQGHPIARMEPASMPGSGAAGNPGMPVTSIPSSMHQMVGAGLPPHMQQQHQQQQQQHGQPQFPAGFPHQHQHQQQLQHLQQQRQQHAQQQQYQQHLLHQQQLQQQQEKQKQQHHHQQKMHQQQPPPPPPPPQPQPQPHQLQHHYQPNTGGGGQGEESSANRTLRNITNSAAATPPPSLRHPPPAKSSSIIQMMGLPGQPRPPPPYPYQPPPITQHQQQPPQQQPPTMPEYWGHDPVENIPPDMCLLGCMFCICDYQEQVCSEEIDVWKQIIEQYGGKVVPVYSEAVTHVLAADQKEHPVKTQALKDDKRLVTAYWLNDCLVQKKMLPPWQAMHIPLMFTGEKPCKNQIISITNFTGEERTRVKQMINAIGAKYTGYMTRSNSVLVCKRPGGTKFEKAKEWRVPVVNVQWLSDLVLGEMDALRLPVQMRYLQVGHARDFNADLSKVWRLMVGWTKSLKVSKETWQKFVPSVKKPVKTEVSDSTVSSSSEPPAKKARVEEDSPVTTEDGVPRILFTGYPRSVVNRLTTIAEKLGGEAVENPQNCTHLVAQKISRTIKFFHAINVCRHIITKEWLEESSLQGRFLEEEKYQLKDEVGEQEIGCNLQESLRRAQKSHIFEGLIFYITPGVTPPVAELTKVIESAGGATLKRRPSIKSTAKMRDEKGRSTFIVITCPNDLHLCRDLMAQNIDVYSAELALTGVLRQELDLQMYRIDYHMHTV